MDPNAALAEIRRLAELTLTLYVADADAEAGKAGAALAEQIDALDEWITRGGFLPDAWKEGR